MAIPLGQRGWRAAIGLALSAKVHSDVSPGVLPSPLISFGTWFRFDEGNGEVFDEPLAQSA